MEEEYFGKFSYAVTFIGFFTVILDMCSEFILVRESSKGTYKQSELFGAGLILKGIFIFGAVVSALIINYILFRNESVFFIILIIIFSIPFSVKLPSFRSVFDSVCKSHYKAVHSSINDLSYHMVLISLTVFGIYVLNNREFLVWGYALCGIPGLIYLASASLKIVKPEFKKSRKLYAYLIRESLPIAALTLLFTLTARMDIQMIEYFGNYGEVGLYSVVFRLCEPLLFIPVSVVISFFPLMSKLFHEESDGLAKVYGFGIKVMIITAIPLAVFISGFSHNILELFYRPMYLPASAALSIYIYTIIFGFISVISNHFLVAAGKQIFVLYFFIAAAVTNFICNLILIPEYGYIGASIATVFTEGLICILYLLSTRSYLHEITWREIVRLSITYGTCCTAFFYIKQFSPVIAAVEIIILCPVLAFASGFFNKNEMSRIKSALKL